VARPAACQHRGLAGLRRSEPHAWETSRGAGYDLRGLRYEERLAIAIAEGGRRKEVRFFGTIAIARELPAFVWAIAITVMPSIELRA
jgi:hypothetical protein